MGPEETLQDVLWQVDPTAAAERQALYEGPAQQSAQLHAAQYTGNLAASRLTDLLNR